MNLPYNQERMAAKKGAKPITCIYPSKTGFNEHRKLWFDGYYDERYPESKYNFDNATRETRDKIPSKR